MIKISLNNNKVLEVEEGISSNEILKRYYPRGIKETLAVRFNEKMVDLNQPLNENGNLELVTFNGEDGKEVFWHSSSHLMAQAVKELFPKATTIWAG